MLAKRVLTAIIGIIASIFIVNYGQWVYSAAVLVLAILAWLEFYNMMLKLEIKIAYKLGIAAVILLWGAAWLGNSKEIVAIIMLSCFVLLIKTVLSHGHFNLRNAGYTITGLIYIGLSFAHLIMLRFTDGSLYIGTSLLTLQAGAVYIWLAFIGTWASDTFAFFIGTKFGRHKLAPTVSPNKSWEGTIGGIIGSVLAVTVCGYLWQLSLIHSVAMGLVVGLTAPLGDLVESSIKRFAGVKDSGKLLPGHGGVLDRFDSIMFAVPAMYYYVYIFLVR